MCEGKFAVYFSLTTTLNDDSIKAERFCVLESWRKYYEIAVISSFVG